MMRKISGLDQNFNVSTRNKYYFDSRVVKDDISRVMHTKQKVSSIVGLRSYGQHFLWDMNNTKWCNGFHIQFRQTFAKETFSYDEHLKS